MTEFLESLNDKEAQAAFAPADIEKYKVMGILPYIFPILFFLPIVMDKNSAYCKFHANQQLTWFIVTFIVQLISIILAFIPVLGAILTGLISLCVLAITVFLAYSAYQNKAVRLPVVGKMISVF